MTEIILLSTLKEIEMKEICKGLNYFFINFFHIYHNVTKKIE